MVRANERRKSNRRLCDDAIAVSSWISRFNHWARCWNDSFGGSSRNTARISCGDWPSIERSAAREMQVASKAASGGFPVGMIAIFAVIVLIGAWLGVRVMAKRSSAMGASRIRAVADRARQRGGFAVSNSGANSMANSELNSDSNRENS